MADGTYTTPEDEAFFAAIGRLTLSWAHIEFGLDGITFMLHHGAGGNQVERDIPWSLSRKLIYIGRCFKKIDSLKGEQTAICDLMDRIGTASEKRHDIIHGIVVEQEEGSGQASMIRLLRGGEPMAHKSYSVNTIDILKAAVDAERLAGEVMPIANHMLETLKAALKKMQEARAKI